MESSWKSTHICSIWRYFDEITKINILDKSVLCVCRASLKSFSYNFFVFLFLKRSNVWAWFYAYCIRKYTLTLSACSIKRYWFDERGKPEAPVDPLSKSRDSKKEKKELTKKTQNCGMRGFECECIIICSFCVCSAWMFIILNFKLSSWPSSLPIVFVDKSI